MDEVGAERRDPAGAVVRRAEPADAEVLGHIAFASKGHWGYPERWMASWKDALTIPPGFVRDNDVYLAETGGEIVGFYALVREDTGLWLDHLWVPPGRMGAGLGRTLFEHAARRAGALGAGTFRIEADPHAATFYAKMGARRVGERVYEIEGQRRALPILLAAST